jgi:hypothetical protein
MSFLKNNWIYLVAVVLFVIIVIQRCQGPKVETKIERDTVVITKVIDKPVPGKPIYIRGDKDTIWVTLERYIPDITYHGLLKQYKEIGDKFFTKNVFSTTYPIDTIGEIVVWDTIQENRLKGSLLIPNLRLHSLIITNTITNPPKRQVYIGGGIVFSPNPFVPGIQLQGLYKDRKDRIFGIGAGYNGEMFYSASIYWKIKLKKDK